jgi:hypothetical protein
MLSIGVRPQSHVGCERVFCFFTFIICSLGVVSRGVHFKALTFIVLGRWRDVNESFAA